MEGRTLRVLVLLAIPVYGVLLFLLIIDASQNHNSEVRSSNARQSWRTAPLPHRPPLTPAPHHRQRRKLAVSEDYVSVHDANPKGAVENGPIGKSLKGGSRHFERENSAIEFDSSDVREGAITAKHNRANKEAYDSASRDLIQEDKAVGRLVQYQETTPEETEEEYYDDEEDDGDYKWTKDYYKYKNFARHRMFADIFAPSFPIENGGRCPNDTKVFLFVNSRVESASIRTAIRSSYLKSLIAKGVHYAFLISSPSDELKMFHLQEENETYGDIVVVGSREGYTNLSLKTGHLLHWARRHCPGDAYVAKVDDDVYVNVPKFLQVIEKPRNKTILGQVCSKCIPYSGDGVPLRIALTMTQDVLTRRNLPLKTLPPFAKGPAYVVTADSIPLMEEAAQLMPHLGFEDVFWTGLVVEKVNLESGKTLAMAKDEGSVRIKYLTLRGDAPRVTLQRENIPEWRHDLRTTSKDLDEVIRKARLAVILHGVSWDRDKDLVAALDALVL